jgi:ABC-2 type transport system permease protein
VNLWRLEWLRLLRTRRFLSVLFIFVGFGFLSPVTVRYLPDILEKFGGSNIQITVSEPTPGEGMKEFVGNVQQMGTLVVVLIAASAFAIDSRPELGAFLRSRVATTRLLLAPKLAVNGAYAAGAFLLGSLAAWYETVVLLGDLPAGRTIAAIAAGMLFEVFVVAVVCLSAGLSRGFVQIAVTAVALLLSLPLLALLDPLAPWLPSQLGAMAAELDRSHSLFDYIRPAAVTLVFIPLAIRYAALRLDHREV